MTIAVTAAAAFLTPAVAHGSPSPSEDRATRTAGALADLGTMLRVRHSYKCLTVQGASRENSAATLQYTCDNNAPFNEQWYFDDVRAGDDYVHIRNRHSDKCLTVKGASAAESVAVVQYTCDYSAPYNEEWLFVSVSQSANNWHIVNRLSSKCLTIQNNSTADNARALQYTCNFNPYQANQEWEKWSHV